MNDPEILVKENTCETDLSSISHDGRGSVSERMQRLRQDAHRFMQEHPAYQNAIQFLSNRTVDPLKCFGYSIQPDGKLVVYPGEKDTYIPDDVRRFFGADNIIIERSRSRMVLLHDHENSSRLFRMRKPIK